jgi:hypothetical protein
LNNPNQNQDDGHHQENVDESPHGVRRHKPQQPCDNENQCKRIEHIILSPRLERGTVNDLFISPFASSNYGAAKAAFGSFGG